MSARLSLLRSVHRPGHWLACLAVVALLARALVAPGYMPDDHAAREGRLAVALCAGGSVDIRLDPAGAPAVTGDDCTYAALPPWTPEPMAAAVAGPVRLAAGPPYRLRPSGPPASPMRAGPPLGSRAPPLA